MHLVPLLTGAIDVHKVVAILITCMVQAVQQTLPEQRKRSGSNTLPSNPWFDAECKAAKTERCTVMHQSTRKTSCAKISKCDFKGGGRMAEAPF